MMKRHILTIAIGCGVLGALGASAALSAAPKGNAYGYWAGRLCDHIGPSTNGVPYWQSRHYPDRGTCVELEGQSLQRGEWDPAAWPI